MARAPVAGAPETLAGALGQQPGRPGRLLLEIPSSRQTALTLPTASARCMTRRRIPCTLSSRVIGRSSQITGRAALERSLAGFMRYYNDERPHQGYRLRGRSPSALVWGAVKA